MVAVHNLGVESIVISADLIISDDKGNIIDGTWTNVDTSSPITEINPGDYGKVTLDCCGDEGEPACPNTCQFQIVLGGRTQTATIYCPG